MTTRTSQILLIISAFMTGLVVFSVVFLYATGNFGSAGTGSSAIGGRFKLIDQNGNSITDADRTGALFVTVDPERDTAAVMKDYLSSFDPHLRGATGDRASIDAAEKAYRVYAKKVPGDNGEYSMDHTALVYLMNKQGRFVAPFNLKRRPEEAAADLKRYL